MVCCLLLTEFLFVGVLGWLLLIYVGGLLVFCIAVYVIVGLFCWVCDLCVCFDLGLLLWLAVYCVALVVMVLVCVCLYLFNSVACVFVRYFR